jgi:CRP-like cAMP-binding protein
VTLLDHASGLPVRDLEVGDVLIREGDDAGPMFIVGAGTFEVTRAGALVAIITEPGVVVGEISALLDTTAGATVRATSPARVHVVDDPATFLASAPEGVLEVAKVLARRLQRMVSYLADIKVQYGDESGHLGLVDEVLAELTFGEPAAIEPGSDRDPDPYY